MNDESPQKIEAAIDRLFRLPAWQEPPTDRQNYVSTASATFNSLPFRVLVTQMRDELTKICVSHDKNTPSGDWIRGGIYALDQLYQRFELLDSEHKQPKE